MSMTIASILMAGMASAMLIASHAVPSGQDSGNSVVQCRDALDRITGELHYATSVTEATMYAATFTVADRNHGDPGPETIRYAWSGTPGDPLTRQYNGGTVAAICEDVQDFSLVYSVRATQLQAAPRVLLVTDDASAPDTQDVAKKAAMESWGYTVQLMSDSAPASEFSTLMADSDVIYISERIWGPSFLDKPTNVEVGMVFEEGYLYNASGIAWGYDTVWGSQIGITDNSHEITSGFSIGSLSICSGSRPLITTDGSLAPGGQKLAKLGGGASLLVIEAGGELYGGGTAMGRRVKLPWGGGPFVEFDFSTLNSAGLTLMRGAIEWAAAPIAYAGVQIALQAGPDSAGRVETQTQILNKPEVNGP